MRISTLHTAAAILAGVAVLATGAGPSRAQESGTP